MAIKTNLDTLPDNALKKILEKCDFLGILSLRKTCRSLRSSILLNKPEFHIQDLEIHQISAESIQMTITIPNKEDIEIEYKQHGFKCQLSSKTHQKFIENQDFLQIFFQDLAIIFEGQPSGFPFGYLEIKFDNEDIRLYEILEKYLNSLGSPLKVKHFNLEVYDQYQVLGILPYISLRGKLWISYTEEKGSLLNLEEVVKLEQWKESKEIDIRWATVVQGVKDFLHFENCEVSNFETLKPEDVVMVKETFFSSDIPECFRLGYNNFTDSQNLLESIFGEPDDIGPELKGWWLIIPRRGEALNVEITNEHVEFTRTMAEHIPYHIIEKKRW